MIIWINGSFGSGKTSTAKALTLQLKDSYLYDPEEAGFFIRDNIPNTLEKNDFQDFEIWRDINYRMLKFLDANHTGPIIVPMTLVNQMYFDEIINKLVNEGIDVRHFSLIAKKETLIKRLSLRGDQKNPWILDKIDNCIESLNRSCFDTHIHTDNKITNEVVIEILSLIKQA